MCITHPIAKRINGIIGYVQIIGSELLEPGSIRQWPACIHVVIIDRDLSDILRPGCAKLSRRVDSPKQYVGYGVSGFGTAKPHIQDSGDMVILPFDGKRSAC